MTGSIRGMVIVMGSPLDPFIPRYDIREYHTIRVDAPAGLAWEAAQAFDFEAVPLIRAIIRLRLLFLGTARTVREPKPFLQESRAMGWGTLVDEPGQLYVAGAFCQPWIGDVKFEPVPPGEFATRQPPSRVKIAWTLQVEPLGPASSRVSTETRAVTTDDDARRRFGRYWRWARFGIVTIRWVMLPRIKREAERAWRDARDRSKSPRA